VVGGANNATGVWGGWPAGPGRPPAVVGVGARAHCLDDW